MLPLGTGLSLGFGKKDGDIHFESLSPTNYSQKVLQHRSNTQFTI